MKWTGSGPLRLVQILPMYVSNRRNLEGWMSDDVVEFRGSVMITNVRVLVGQSVAQFETLVHEVPKNDGSRFSMMASTIDEANAKRRCVCI